MLSCKTQECAHSGPLRGFSPSVGSGFSEPFSDPVRDPRGNSAHPTLTPAPLFFLLSAQHHPRPCVALMCLLWGECKPLIGQAPGLNARTTHCCTHPSTRPAVALVSTLPHGPKFPAHVWTLYAALLDQLCQQRALEGTAGERRDFVLEAGLPDGGGAEGGGTS